MVFRKSTPPPKPPTDKSDDEWGTCGSCGQRVRLLPNGDLPNHRVYDAKGRWAYCQ